VRVAHMGEIFKISSIELPGVETFNVSVEIPNYMDCGSNFKAPERKIYQGSDCAPCKFRYIYLAYCTIYCNFCAIVIFSREWNNELMLHALNHAAMLNKF